MIPHEGPGIHQPEEDLSDGHGISETDLAGYTDVFADPRARRSIARTFAAYPRSLPFLQEIRRGLKNIAAPTQIVFGDGDAYCTPANGRAFAEHIPGARFELLAGVGHFASEEVPETIAARVRDMIAPR